MGLLRHLDGYAVRAQLYLERQIHRGAFLIVEGEGDDKALSRFVDPLACSIIIANGKPNALEAMDLLDEDGFDRVFCIVDADFDRIDEVDRSNDVIAVTDYHDMDVTIFSTSAFDSYLRVHADVDKMAASIKRTGKTARELILTAAEPLGRLRLINDHGELWLDFKRLPIDKYPFIDQRTLACDEQQMLQVVLGASPRAKCDQARLAALMDAVRGHSHDLLQLCNGHDVAAIAGIALRELLGGRRDVHTWGTEIQAGLRLAFDRDAFHTTQVYSRLKAWCETSARRKILRV